MERWLRSSLMYLSRHAFAMRMAEKYGLRYGGKRFVAGEQLEEAVATVQELNARGIVATLDHLGENTTNEEAAKSACMHCVATLERITETGISSHLSLKLTQLGLDISPEVCLSHMRTIMDTAVKHRHFVRIDMEDYAHNLATIAIFKELRAAYGPAIGLVLQACLYKSVQDIQDLQALKPNLRLVKGAYKESAQVAYAEKSKVDDQFLRMIEIQLESGNYAAIATHDERVIDDVKKYVQANQIPRSQFEFQMLYGIRPQEQQRLASEGYTMRVYVPYGTDWYGYFMRRMAERPANVLFVLKSMFTS